MRIGNEAAQPDPQPRETPAKRALDRIAASGTRIAGGRVHAYGGTTAECLRLASRRARVTYAELECACPFDGLGTLHALLATHAADKLDEVFDADGIRLRLPAAHLSCFRERLRELDKLGMRNTAELVRYAVQRGLVS